MPNAVGRSGVTLLGGHAMSFVDFDGSLDAGVTFYVGGAGAVGMSSEVSSTRASGTIALMKDDAKTVKQDVKDTVNELKHRTVAEGEHLKRDVFGDEMATGENVKSGANELKNRVEAQIDKTKRDLRHGH
jgi:hypothetical protein